MLSQTHSSGKRHFPHRLFSRGHCLELNNEGDCRSLQASCSRESQEELKLETELSRRRKAPSNLPRHLAVGIDPPLTDFPVSLIQSAELIAGSSFVRAAQKRHRSRLHVPFVQPHRLRHYLPFSELDNNYNQECINSEVCDLSGWKPTEARNTRMSNVQGKQRLSSMR